MLILPLLFSCNPKQVPVETVKQISAEIDSTQTSGILAPHILLSNLTHDYETVTSPLAFRARKLIIDTNGVVGKHAHDTRLGYAYITSGEVMEYRDGSESKLRKKGDFVTEGLGTTHYWHNNSDTPTRAIVFDITPPEKQLQPTLHRELKLDGPRENIGIKEVQVLNTLSLSPTYAELEGRVLRARLFTLNPDAVIGQHIHQERSGYVYVVSGEIVEVRNDTDKPLTRRTGDLIIEENGVEHYWENKSGAEVKLLSIDIFTPPPKQ